MNLASSLVDSYMYSEMYNREYDGGSNMADKIFVAGLPVGNIVPSISRNKNRTEGGKSNKPRSDAEADAEADADADHVSNHAQKGGPFSDKVVPAGLVLIQEHNNHAVEYEAHFHPGVRRDVLPDSIFDQFIASMSPRRRTTPKQRPPTKNEKTRKKSNNKLT